MDIYFANGKLKKTCNSKKDATQKYGSDNAKKILIRLAQLKDASNLGQFRALHLPGRCHELREDRQGQISLDLKHPFRLIFEPLGENIHKPDGGLDWNLILAVRILSVEDYHHG